MVSQTSVMFFALLVGFIVFITVRGELSAYLQVLGLSSGNTGGLPSLPGLPNLGGAPSVIPYDPSIPVIK